jgi:hypothetical protein
MILYAKIRRMYFRDKLSINEIARRTRLPRNTVSDKGRFSTYFPSVDLILPEPTSGLN